MQNPIDVMRTGIYVAAMAMLTFSFSATAAASTAEPKPASKHTEQYQAKLRASLAFEDQRDFDDQKRGFITEPPYKKIMDGDAVIWDMQRFDFLLQGKDYDSIHPSLQRQAILNMNYGLYEVIPGVYQVRGFDLANITFIKSDTGWIIFDTLTTKETAAAALELINTQLGERPVVGVVYSHNHADHFGGIRGVVDEADVLSGKVKIIAPDGFMDHAISENVYAGNAMNRRLYYQYGTSLEAGPLGHVDQAIGKGLPNGTVGLIAPNLVIEQPIQKVELDGVRMEFQLTPNTEAPSEMNTWFPDLKVFWAAENVTGTIHNIYTLRGAPVRDALAWSKYINKAYYKYGRQAEVMIASHNWPRWGKERIAEVLRGQRDMYAHLNNQVLHLANQGVTVNEIHNEYEVPLSQQQNWYARGYHGSFEHNSRAIINRYLGYWDANPTTLIPESPRDSAPLYVEMMGGAKPIIKRGKALIKEGEYRLAQEILNKLVFAEPDNTEAKLLLADAFEQTGYQQESPSVRNSFLAAALELREGIPDRESPRTRGPDMVRALTMENYFDYLAIQMDARRAEGMEFLINYSLTDTGEQYVLEMSNGALSNIAGYQRDDANLTVTTTREAMLGLIAQQTTYPALAQAGKLTLEGDPSVLAKLRSTMVEFNPLFEMMPGTAR